MSPGRTLSIIVTVPGISATSITRQCGIWFLYVVLKNWMNCCFTLTKEDALKALVGSKNAPYGEQDFLTLQKAVLDMYKIELLGILDEVKTWEDADE